MATLNFSREGFTPESLVRRMPQREVYTGSDTTAVFPPLASMETPTATPVYGDMIDSLNQSMNGGLDQLAAFGVGYVQDGLGLGADVFNALKEHAPFIGVTIAGGIVVNGARSAWNKITGGY